MQIPNLPKFPAMTKPYICNLQALPNGHQAQPWLWTTWLKFSYSHSLGFQLRTNIFPVWTSFPNNWNFENFKIEFGLFKTFWKLTLKKNKSKIFETLEIFGNDTKKLNPNFENFGNFWKWKLKNKYGLREFLEMAT